MRTTIRDVAEKAGVSPTSVSLVLSNKKSRISEETKQKIFDAADELNYVTKKRVVKNDLNVTEKIIGFIYPALYNGLIEECINGIENYALVYGYHIIQMYCSDSPQRCLEQIALAAHLGVDGVIVFPPSDMNADGNNEKLDKALKSIGIPYLLLDKAVYQVFCDFVTVDYKLCSGMATNYLISKGHSKIGILVGKHDLYNTKKHIDGYREELILNGMAFDEELIYYCDCDQKSENQGTKYLVEKGVTAIVSCDKSITLGVYSYARKNNIIIGEDISVIGIGGGQEIECMNPQLACVQQPGKQMGIKAIEVIVGRINKIDVGGVKTHYFTPIIIEGKSVKTINKN